MKTEQLDLDSMIAVEIVEWITPLLPRRFFEALMSRKTSKARFGFAVNAKLNCLGGKSLKQSIEDQDVLYEVLRDLVWGTEDKEVF